MKVNELSQLYATLLEQLHNLLSDKKEAVTNATVTAELLFHNLPDVNWAGFYLREGNHLALGPFQGQRTCKRIKLGQDGCSMDPQQRDTIIINDVHDAPANFLCHVLCEKEVKSQIIIPLVKKDQLLGVLDLDSTKKSRFTDSDKIGLERIVTCFLEHTDSGQYLH